MAGLASRLALGVAVGFGVELKAKNKIVADLLVENPFLMDQILLED